MAKILGEFLCTDVEVGTIEEPAEKPVHAFHGDHAAEVVGTILRAR